MSASKPSAIWGGSASTSSPAWVRSTTATWVATAWTSSRRRSPLQLTTSGPGGTDTDQPCAPVPPTASRLTRSRAVAGASTAAMPSHSARCSPVRSRHRSSASSSPSLTAARYVSSVPPPWTASAKRSTRRGARRSGWRRDICSAAFCRRRGSAATACSRITASRHPCSPPSSGSRYESAALNVGNALATSSDRTDRGTSPRRRKASSTPLRGALRRISVTRTAP